VNRRILRALLSYITSGECDVETGIIAVSIFGGLKMPVMMTTIRSIFLNSEIFKRPSRDHYKRSKIGKVGVNFIARYCRRSRPIKSN
jgi:hypothetical protein